MHPRLKAKIPKMLEWRFHKADWYIWLDSSIKLNENIDLPELILQTSNGNPLCLFKHSKLKSITEECKLIKRKTRKDLPYFYARFGGEPIASQTRHYLQDNDFRDDKLFQMTFFAYHYSARLLMQEWFLQNCMWSIKDQISFPYVLSKSGLKYSLFKGSVSQNDYFKWCWEEREVMENHQQDDRINH